jgi:DinB superfamily
MTREERNRKVELFGRAPTALAAALRQFPKKMWMYKPAEDRWSIHEIILHLADSEANSYIRCRRLIAEPGKPVLSYNPEIWAGTLGYFHQSTKEALDLIRRLRKMTHQVLINLPQQIWYNTVEHPEDGALSLDQWLDIQVRHIPHHLEQMKHNYAVWSAAHPPRKPASASIKTMAASSTQFITLSATL